MRLSGRPTSNAWSCIRLQGELAMAFAERSRNEADAYLRGLWSGDVMLVHTERAVPVAAGPDQVAFVFTLDTQDRAHLNVAPHTK